MRLGSALAGSRREGRISGQQGVVLLRSPLLVRLCPHATTHHVVEYVVIVVPSSEGGEELTIWDSHESEFASGLEYSGYFATPVNDLDWSSTPDAQSILAVGFLDHVDIYYQQRMTYFDDAPGWAICHRIDLSG